MHKILYEEKQFKWYTLFPFRFRIYSSKIEVSFFPYKYEIPFSDIKGIKIVNKIPWWVGWGLRLNPFSKTLYFLSHHKKCVQVERKSGYWKKIILSVKNPEKFITHLRNLKFEEER